ncbi:hypothetical protein A2U01_0029788, partial [Trifolium medium]|nr:hypothetical protein [Trifolium medium]
WFVCAGLFAVRPVGGVRDGEQSFRAGK